MKRLNDVGDKVHRVLDYAEWSPDTLDEIAEILTAEGYEIHPPRNERTYWSRFASEEVGHVRVTVWFGDTDWGIGNPGDIGVQILNREAQNNQQWDDVFSTFTVQVKDEDGDLDLALDRAIVLYERIIA